MLIRILNVLAVIASVISFIGCSHAPLSKSFNEANANNIAVQTVNPNAGKDDVALTALDGQKAEQAMKRYRLDPGKAQKEVLITNIGQ